MEKLGINLGLLFVQILSFIVMVVVLRAWVFKPLMAQLEKRRKIVAQGLEDARVAAEARANAEKEASRIIAEAQAKAAEIVREATERAEAVAREVRVAQEEELRKQREQALAELEQERHRVLSEMRGQIAALAIAATQKLIKETLDEQRQRALLEEFFSGVRGGKVVVLENETLAGGGGAAEVTSALPLTPEEQEVVKQDILARLGGSASVTFRVDPSILGGLIVRVGDRIIDGSVAGQLQNLRQHLQ
ncbi:F0F1 ATP synthase subunit B [uncultured Thermanaerothrix sp.]|uniref:F0F1 ATP synthase subunit B n=1 Tax=uncultured Thermanaerothrix sp. TaxID=1195149 RepID=UPI00262A49AB|nr:F0F1 ATP synthase subunit B [uncultured Thermanaerothrix sp.]